LDLFDIALFVEIIRTFVIDVGPGGWNDANREKTDTPTQKHRSLE
jgi:hypothetical protein